MAPMGLRARLLLFVVLAAVLPLGAFGAAAIPGRAGPPEAPA